MKRFEDKIADERKSKWGRESWRKWYGLKSWKQARLTQLSKQPLCERHLKRGKIVSAQVVHHKQAHKGDWQMFTNLDNLESVCKRCHDGDIQSEEVRGHSTRVGNDGWPADRNHPANAIIKQPYSIPHNVVPSAIELMIICGPPASGKTTLARELAGKDDIIIDLDDYREHVSGDRYSRSKRHLQQAFKMRNKDIYSLASKRTGKAYLIVMAPTLAERNAWLSALGTKTTIHHLNVPKSECARRIIEDSTRDKARSSLLGALDNYYEAYETDRASQAAKHGEGV